MNCLICGKIAKLNKMNLFTVRENFEICNKCKMEYMLGIYFRKIPIKKGFIWHFYLSEVKLSENIKNKLEQLLRPIYLISNFYQKTVFILDDFFDENMFKIIDNLNFNDIITVTYDI